MDLRTYCERIVFGTDLGDKLLAGRAVQIPQVDADSRRQAAPFADRSVDQPGRPPGAGLTRGRGAPFPSDRELETDEGQARALHFFANHELLALELMALTLLRFPALEPAFVSGLLRTMSDEQRHFSLYCARMKVLGLSFGDLPQSGYFWRCGAKTSSPSEFCATIGLTLEQANLDFAAHYGELFRRQGQDEPARILRQVLADEIRHVAHGLQWFRRWSAVDDDADLFSAHGHALVRPLNLARARGISFSREARQAAGFPDVYIDALEAHCGSKGRPPAVHLFNPGCEQEILGQEEVSAGMQRVRRDLELLPAWLAAADDIVLLERQPRPEFIADLRRHGCALADLRWPTDGDANSPAASLGPRWRRAVTDVPKFGELKPWGWSPWSHQILSPLLTDAAGASRFYAGPWRDELAQLHGKSWAVPLLADVLSGVAETETANLDLPRLSELVMAGQVCRERTQVWACVFEQHAQHGLDVVIKAEYAASGRSAIRVRAGLATQDQERWLDRVLERHPCVQVQPWLDRVCDVSLRLLVAAPGEVRRIGWGRSRMDRRGQYLGGYVGRTMASIPREAARFLAGEGKDSHWLDRVFIQVARAVADWLAPVGYFGPVGVDAFVYRNSRGTLQLQPLVEANVRNTMGHVCTALDRHVSRGSLGNWSLVNVKTLQKRWGLSALAFAEAVAERHPRVWTSDASGERLLSGVLFTTDPERCEDFVSYLHVSRSLLELERGLQL
jgi:uncharacterized ferritin-like protein (DUF455 family)